VKNKEVLQRVKEERTVLSHLAYELRSEALY
jgi:hypothetical protein